LSRTLGLRACIQHNPEDFASLPKFPARLE
jgi:hypothetical protein